MHEATFKLVWTQRQYVDRSYWVVATNYWWIVGIFLNAEKHFYKVKNALSERCYRIYTYFFVITLRLYSKFERKL